MSRAPKVGDVIRIANRYSLPSLLTVVRATDSTAWLDDATTVKARRGSFRPGWDLHYVSPAYRDAMAEYRVALSDWMRNIPGRDDKGRIVHVYTNGFDPIDVLIDASCRPSALAETLARVDAQCRAVMAWMQRRPIEPREADYPLAEEP